MRRLIFLAAAVIALLPATAGAAARYSVQKVDFQARFANDQINRNGLTLAIAGGGAAQHWRLVTADGKRVVADMPHLAYPYALNDKNETAGSLTICGGGHCVDHAMIWNSAGLHDLGLAGGTSAKLTAINDKGEAGGSIEVAGAAPGCPVVVNGVPMIDHAIFFDGQRLHDLGKMGGVCGSWMAALNNSGVQVVAQIGREWNNRVLLIRDGKRTDIGNLGSGMFAIAINDAGDVVGWGKLDLKRDHAFLYRGGKLIDLGTLGGDHSFATGVGMNGDVVGRAQTAGGDYHAFFYQKGVMADLNTLVDWGRADKTGVPVLSSVSGIGADGRILATVSAKNGPVTASYLLTPELDAPALALTPGMVFTYSTGGRGVAATGMGGGDGDLIYRVVAQDKSGLKLEFALTGAAPVNGTQTISAADLAGARTLHTAFKPGDNSANGRSALPRLSDAVYRDLKAGKKTALAFDGTGDPQLLSPDGTDSVTLSIDDRAVSVAALRARGAHGCHLWIKDDAALPMLLKHDCGGSLVATAAYDPKVVSAALVEKLSASGPAATSTILFDFNSASIQPTSRPVLDALGVYLRANEGLRLVIQGHTDNVGTAAQNQALSLRRAEAVKSYLVQSSVVASRLETRGFGFTEALADNATPEGRSRNRRVVFQPEH
jgi:probable HAF family extracellular repeat protein